MHILLHRPIQTIALPNLMAPSAMMAVHPDSAHPIAAAADIDWPDASTQKANPSYPAAVDARNEGLDIFILARTDALIHGWDEALTRANEIKRIGVDAVFTEALPDRESDARGGKTESLSAADLAQLEFRAVAYPWTLVAVKLKSIRETLEGLKRSMTVGAPPVILSYGEVSVGFNRYWDREVRYEVNQVGLVNVLK
ncbi:hypothetical protein BJX64DRAFT_291605 [Aspergillus heterothallicus]